MSFSLSYLLALHILTSHIFTPPYTIPVYIKSDADIARISKMLAANFMFQNLTATQKEKVSVDVCWTFCVLNVLCFVVYQLLLDDKNTLSQLPHTHLF